MAWYYGAYRCGHEGRANIPGPVRNRQYVADGKFSGLCPNCYEEKLRTDRENEREAAHRQSVEMNLPELSGSEKQVAWAIVLRQNLVDYIHEQIGLAGREGKQEAVNDLNSFMEYIFNKYTKASFFIDELRDGRHHEFISRYAKEYFEQTSYNPDKPPIDKKAEEEIKAESTIYPEGQKHTVSVDIVIRGNAIQVKAPRNDTLRVLVKDLGCGWSSDNRCWERDIIPQNGTVEDRAAELANKVLAGGFAVTVMDADIRRKAVEADFKPEHYNWISLFTAGDYEGNLCIKWRGRNEHLYQLASSLPYAKWAKVGVSVRIEYYKEVLDFAELYDFRLTQAAQDTIDKYIVMLGQAARVKPASAPKIKPKDGLRELLDAEDGIIDDLKDEPL